MEWLDSIDYPYYPSVKAIVKRLYIASVSSPDRAKSTGRIKMSAPSHRNKLKSMVIFFIGMVMTLDVHESLALCRVCDRGVLTS